MDPQQLYADIVARLAAGEPVEPLERAIDELRRADAEGTHAALALAELRLRQGRVDDAERAVRTALERRREVDLELELGRVMAIRGDLEGALEVVRMAVLQAPNSLQGASFLGALALRLGGAPRFCAELGRVAAAPQSWRAQVLLGKRAADDGDDGAAARWWREALARSPDAAALVRRGAPERATAIVPELPLLESRRDLRWVPVYGPLWRHGRAAAQARRPLWIVWALSDASGASPGPRALGMTLYLAESLALRTDVDPVAVIPVHREQGFAHATRPPDGAPPDGAWILGHLRGPSLELSLGGLAGGLGGGPRRLEGAARASDMEEAVVAAVADAGLATRPRPAELTLPADTLDATWLPLLAGGLALLLRRQGTLSDAAAPGEAGWREACRRCAATNPRSALPDRLASAVLGDPDEPAAT